MTNSNSQSLLVKSLSKTVDYSYMTKVSLIHRWLSNSSPEGDDESVFNNPLVHWCHNVCGPVGNSGGCHQKNQQSFNSVKWLESQGAALGGFIIHTGEYVNCIQIIGNQEQSGMPFNIYLMILWSLIVWVGVVLKRTVVIDKSSQVKSSQVNFYLNSHRIIIINTN